MSGAQARGAGGPGAASISINPTNMFADLSNKSQSISRGQVLIHELFHVGGYDHVAMALAVYNVGGKFEGWKYWQGEFPDPVDPVFSGPNGQGDLDHAYAGFFYNVLRQHCK